MTVSAVLFDLDGTLVDSLEDLTDAVNHMRTSLGYDTITSATVRGMVGNGARNLVQRALDSDADELIEQGLTLFTDFNRNHIADKSRLYPGMKDALEMLAERGIPMAVVSNKNENLSRLILEALGIDHFFARVCGGDTYPERKPSPLPLLRVMDNLGYRPGQTVMIGDSINDIQAGRTAGIATIGCTWGYGEADELRDSDFLADSCGQIAHILLQRMT